jgi:tRNA1(Val) A37 N6-methylase TrmN6
MSAPAETSSGTLLGGLVRYAQAAGGHRSGLEPVLLAAATRALPGARVLEAGSGAGAALLCLAARVPGIAGLGIERDPALVALASGNAAANGFSTLRFETGDIARFPADGSGGEAPFDHAIANPPWHEPRGTSGADPAREAARRGRPGLMAAWVAAMAAALRPRGTLGLIIAAGVVPEAMAAMAESGIGSIRLIPVGPRVGQAAKLTIVQGVRGGRAPMVLAPGLVLHEADGRFTAAADAVLRDCAAIP